MKYPLLCLLLLICLSCERRGSHGLDVDEDPSSSSEDTSHNSSDGEISSSLVLSSNSTDSLPLLYPEEVLFRSFPTRQVSQEDDFVLTWSLKPEVIPEAPGIEVNIYSQILGEGEEWVGQVLDQDSMIWDLSGIENGTRMRLFVYLTLNDSIVVDSTGYFDVHNGKTPYVFDRDIEPFFTKYCVQCHGNSGGLTLESYTQITQANTPLYIMNRVNYIGDMPESGSRQPTESERLMVRDWILGGTPKN